MTARLRVVPVYHARASPSSSADPANTRTTHHIPARSRCASHDRQPPASPRGRIWLSLTLATSRHERISHGGKGVARTLRDGAQRWAGLECERAAVVVEPAAVGGV